MRFRTAVAGLAAERQRPDVHETGAHGRPFTAEIGRLKATHNFTARVFLRLIDEYFTATQSPALYSRDVPAGDRSFIGTSGCALRGP